MDRLEKFILENREWFDENEPSRGHFDRFTDKLDSRFGNSRKKENKMFMLRIAAGFLIMLAISVFLFRDASKWIKSSSGNTSSSKDLPSELQEAVNYYNASANDHLSKIEKLACCGQDSKKIYSMASDELNALDANTQELKKTLQENPDDRVKAALVKNQLMKEQVMTTMIRQMKNIKK